MWLVLAVCCWGGRVRHPHSRIPEQKSNNLNKSERVLHPPTSSLHQPFGESPFQCLRGSVVKFKSSSYSASSVVDFLFMLPHTSNHRRQVNQHSYPEGAHNHEYRKK